VITCYAGDDLPVFLVTVFSKGRRADLAAADRAEIKKELSKLASDYRKGIRECAKLLRRS
jgi:hypothetical protein